MAGAERSAFREVLPKEGLLYTQESPELVRVRKIKYVPVFTTCVAWKSHG